MTFLELSYHSFVCSCDLYVYVGTCTEAGLSQIASASVIAEYPTLQFIEEG